jgi:hypothetical protein
MQQKRRKLLDLLNVATGAKKTAKTKRKKRTVCDNKVVSVR